MITGYSDEIKKKQWVDLLIKKLTVVASSGWIQKHLKLDSKTSPTLLPVSTVGLKLLMAWSILIDVLVHVGKR